MLNLFRKPLFWSNVASLVVVGFVAFGIAHGWTNPTLAPVGGSGAISVDSSGNIGIGTAVPRQKLDVLGSVRATGICIGSDCRGSWPFSNMQVFDNSGSWTVPAGVTEIIVEAWGGGAGGTRGYVTDGAVPFGTSGYVWPGGGSAGYGKEIITVTPGEILTITVGNGGFAGSSLYDLGLLGQPSAVSRGSTNLIVANGGGQNNGPTSIAFGHIGGTSSATTNIRGQNGYAGNVFSVGGSAPNGGSGGVVVSGATGPCNTLALVPGGGGAGRIGGNGGSWTPCASHHGAKGRVIIHY